jgi:hypothetical protein
VPGHAKLAHHKDIQRGAEGLCYLKGYRYATPGQCQYQHIWPVTVRTELCRQLLASRGPISKGFIHSVLFASTSQVATVSL